MQQREKQYLPISPGLTKPEFTRRHGIEVAVFIILGASIAITGDPISSFELLAGIPILGCGSSFDSHFTVTTLGHPLRLLGRLNCEVELLKSLEHGIVAGEERDDAISRGSNVYENRILFV